MAPEYRRWRVVVERMREQGIPPFVMAYAVIVVLLMLGSLLG
jgi:hypothetical protein